MNEAAMTIPEQAVGELIFWYRNYRGEEGYRRVRPISLRFGRSDYHKEPQWLLRALDLEKNEQREFALADAKSVVGGPVLDFTADLLPLVGVERAAPPLRAREEIARIIDPVAFEVRGTWMELQNALQKADTILSRAAGQEWRDINLAREAFQRIIDFPYVGVEASHAIISIARGGLTSLSAPPVAEPIVVEKSQMK